MLALIWGDFALGLLIGLIVCALAAAIVARYAYRRIMMLQQRTREAERLAEVGTLTGGLAHEIKNPLSTIQLNLQLLQEDITPQNPAYGRVGHRLDTVKRETFRLREILDDFLRYAGRMEVERKPLELNELLQDLIDFFLPQAQLQRVQLRLKRSPTPITVPLDAKLIKQAVLNLMINALHAMPDGGDLILSAEQQGSDAVIHVTDTGRGIEPEAVKRIFDAYYTTKRGGTGLGLAMARRIAIAHGGSMQVTSELGKGSDFVIRLPLNPTP